MRPIPDALASCPFTRATAATYDVTPRMLRGRRFRRLLKDAYVCSDLPLTHDVLAHAALLVVRRGALSHASAVAVLRLPLGVGESDPQQPHVTTKVGLSRSDRQGLVNHVERLPRWQLTSGPYGLTTTPARTFLDRAAELDLCDLVALGDAMLRRGHATAGELERVVRWGRGRRGVVRARLAMGLLDPRSASPMESRVRVILVRAGLPPSDVNGDILDADGDWLACADLIYAAARLIVEYDGRGHLDERQRRADLRRRNLLTAEGWTVLHVTADDLMRRPEQLIALVASYVRP